MPPFDTGTGTGTTNPCTLPSIGNGGWRKWSLSRDADGHRDYSVTYRVKADRDIHGPYSVLSLTEGLPEPGMFWNESALADPWAIFTEQAEVVQVPREAGGEWYDVTLHATTRTRDHCTVGDIGNPLVVPDRIRIETINCSKEQTFDRFAQPIVNSAWEQIRGPQAEFDAHKLRVYIEQNSEDLELDLVQSLMHNLNDAVMWGFEARHIKLSHFEGDPRYYPDCTKFWVRKFIFDIADDFDRCVMDEGTKVLRGYWDMNPNSSKYGQYRTDVNPLNPFSVAPDPDNPHDFIRAKDKNGENIRVILNGRGLPWDPEGITTGTADDTIGENCIEYYPSGNLLLLGIPLDIELAP